MFKKIDLREQPKPKYPNEGKTGKIQYNWSYGVFIEICPFCHEPAYEDDHCVFCGATLLPPGNEEREYARKVNGCITVKYKNIVLEQCAGGCSYYRDGKLTMHSTGINVSEEELLERAKRYYESHIEDTLAKHK